MQLSDYQNAVNDLVDDVVPQSTLIRWLNAGKNEMCQRGDCYFPDIDGTTVTTYPFPDKYDWIPIYYAAQKYLEQNLILDQAKVFQGEFENQISYFLEKYDIPPQYRDNDRCQQFVGVAGQTAYVITNQTYDPNVGRLKVYLNNALWNDWQIPTNPATLSSSVITTATTSNDPKAFIFNPTTTINAGDAITAEWERHADFSQSPYQWWDF